MDLLFNKKIFFRMLQILIYMLTTFLRFFYRVFKRIDFVGPVTAAAVVNAYDIDEAKRPRPYPRRLNDDGEMVSSWM